MPRLLPALILSASALAPLAAQDASADIGILEGAWESAPVRLVRGEIDETYTFALLLLPEDGAELRGTMQVSYGTTGGGAAGVRRIAQSLTARVDAASGTWLLKGGNARLAAGPAIVGTYEPDDLYCTPPAAGASTDRLACRWGSAAHESAPEVTLRRVNGER